MMVAQLFFLFLVSCARFPGNSKKMDVKNPHFYSKNKQINNKFPLSILLSTIEMTSKYSNLAVKQLAWASWFPLSFEHFDVMKFVVDLLTSAFVASLALNVILIF